MQEKISHAAAKTTLEPPQNNPGATSKQPWRLPQNNPGATSKQPWSHLKTTLEATSKQPWSHLKTTLEATLLQRDDMTLNPATFDCPGRAQLLDRTNKDAPERNRTSNLPSPAVKLL
jgi:hypothetical protein